MSYIKEIDECLKVIRSLEESFDTAKAEEELSLSFFSENYDRISELKEKINHLENLQLKEQEEEFIVIEEEETITLREEIEINKTVIVEEKTAAAGFLGDQIGKKLFADIRSSLSLNDRFRFQRDLFDGDNLLMNETLEILNNFTSMEEVQDYLNEHFYWNWEDESVESFKEILEKRFT